MRRDALEGRWRQVGRHRELRIEVRVTRAALWRRDAATSSRRKKRWRHSHHPSSRKMASNAPTPHWDSPRASTRWRSTRPRSTRTCNRARWRCTREEMQKLIAARLLITGLNGLGAEIAKNVILANVNSVTLHDAMAPPRRRLRRALLPDEMRRRGQGPPRRARVRCRSSMRREGGRAGGRLPNGGPRAVPGRRRRRRAARPRARRRRACRAASPPIAFIRTDVRGLNGAVFVDLGPSFVCHDPTGEAIKSAIVESVTVEGAGTDGAKLRAGVGPPPPPRRHHHHRAPPPPRTFLQCVDDEALDLDDGDHVTFSELQGMEARHRLRALRRAIRRNSAQFGAIRRNSLNGCAPAQGRGLLGS